MKDVKEYPWYPSYFVMALSDQLDRLVTWLYAEGLVTSMTIILLCRW